ncbi:AraC family transcriptional regulator, partial [Dactylosporangium sp. NPDC051485]|uniref:AraC family transcriptional regulator n=1 Tax=Dactylosporangium sp. NPDC051485 TaxID=3154846 RepID=UPI00341D92B6
PPVRLDPGDVLFLARGRGHALADAPDTPLAPCRADGPLPPAPAGPGAAGIVLCGAYELAPHRAHPLLDELPDLVHLKAGGELRAVAGLLDAELARHGGGVGVAALLDLLFLHALRAHLQDAPDGGWAAALRDPAVGAALRSIHRDPARAWTVAELAAVGGLSRAPFARRFAALAGRAPLAYLTWWRMTLAARMLRDTDAPLRAVGQRVGYASEFAFAAAFKRRFGTAPGRFRRDSRAPGGTP